MSASAAWPVAHLMQLPRGAYMLARAADRLPSTLCSLGSPRRRAHGRRHVAAASSDVAPRRRQRASDIALRRRACASTRLCALPARTPCTQAAPKPVLRAGGQVATTAPAPSSAGRSSAISAADPGVLYTVYRMSAFALRTGVDTEVVQNKGNSRRVPLGAPMQPRSETRAIP